MRLLRCRKGIAIPISFLILFASTSLIVSVTYYFAVSKVDNRNALINVSAAKHNMEFLSNAIQTTAWITGSSEHFYFSDCGGEFKTEPTANLLLLNITDNESFCDVFFNSSVGRVIYDLPQCDFQTETLYLIGDSRTIVNQSSSTMTQLCIFQGSDSPEIKISYRPTATSSSNGLSGEKPLNILRVYVINLNQSQDLLIRGNFDLRIMCTNVTSISEQYNFTSPISSLTVKATLAGYESLVTVPISSNTQGAAVRIETIICEIKLQRVSD
jgi:hypothetical protein